MVYIVPETDQEVPPFGFPLRLKLGDHVSCIKDY